MKKLNHKLIMLLAPFAIMAGISTTTIAHADSGWDSPVQNGGYISAPGVTITDAQKAEMNAETIAGQKAADEAVKAENQTNADDIAQILAEDKAKGIDPNTDDRLAQGVGVDYNHFNPYTDGWKTQITNYENGAKNTSQNTTKKTAKKTVKKVVANKKTTKKTVAKKAVKKVHTIKTVKKIYAYKTTNTKNHVGRKAIKKGTKYHVVKTVKVGNKKMYEIKGHRFVTANAKYVLIVR